MPSPSALLQVSRAHGSSNLVLYYAKGNTVTGMALPVVVVAIPLAHKSTQVPTPQLIYFCPGKSSDSSSPRSSLVAFPRVSVCLPGGKGTGGNICLKYLTGTCAQQFQLPFVVVWPLPAFCSFCVCVCLRIYIDFFCTFIKFSSGIRSRISTAPLQALTVCFLCYFPAKKKKVSLSISRIMHNNNTKKLKKNTQLWSWTWIQRAWRVGGFAAVTATTATTILWQVITLGILRLANCAELKGMPWPPKMLFFLSSCFCFRLLALLFVICCS